MHSNSFQGFLEKSNEAYFNETKKYWKIEMQNQCKIRCVQGRVVFGDAGFSLQR